ncbi:MAG: hypothetical protein CL910_16495 [Deltaproteobacteria bacterium]|nr:hypothetical protein [Deltaproteobacteria bacterium]
MALPVLLLSVAVLCQELLLVRLLAVGLWTHITYMVVTSALLAFGFAGTLLAVFPRLGGKKGDSGRGAVALWCHLFAATTFVSAYGISHATVDTTDIFTADTTLSDLFFERGFALFSLYLLVGLPLFFGGLAVASALRNAGEALPKTYFANLVGSAAGCAAFLLLLTPLGGPQLLFATAAVGSAAGLLAGGRCCKAALALGGLLVVVCGATAVSADLRGYVMPPIKPVPSKVMHTNVEEQDYEIETTIWDPLCRIDVGRNPADPDRKTVFQDGDAPTFLETPNKPFGAETSVPYVLNPDLQSLCIIGCGGGRELALAAKKGVKRAVGVEINAATVSLLRGPYKEYTDGIVDKPGIDLVNDEGRAFLARTKEKFDCIQMTGVDTYAALASGAYVNSESYLYTADAFDSFLDHLKPGGYFSIIRYFFAGQPRETLRLFIMGIDAVKRRGVAEPWKHVMVIGPIGIWGILVVSNDPIPEAAVTRARGVVGGLPAQNGIKPSIVHNPLGNGETNDFNGYVNAYRKDEAQKWIDEYPLNVSPVTDDSPYLYLYWRWGDVMRDLLGLDREEKREGINPGMANMGQIPTPVMVTLSLVIQAVVVGVLLVLGPLVLFKLRALKLPGTGRSIAYFSSLGLGFMLLEIALAQKFALFLGHPTLSLSVVIGGMLFFSGLGAFASGWFRPERALTIATIAVAALTGALLFLLPLVTEQWLQEGTRTRIVTALAVIAPIAFMMGMPMPSGLRILGRRGGDLVPWAWGVNGVGSVLGSVLAVVLAGCIGFTWVMGIAGGLYLLAALMRVRE